MAETKRSVQLYIGALTSMLGGILAATIITDSGFESHVAAWLALIALFALTEYAQVYFHDEGARFGLTGSESVLTVMIFALSFTQVVWGVVAAIAIERVIRRTSGIKLIFNVAQYGIAAAAAAGVWTSLTVPGQSFTLWTALAAAASVLSFAVLTHVMTSVVIALVEERPLMELSRSVASATVLNLMGSVVLGLLFAAAYSSEPWTLVMFPLPIVVFFLGYTATLRTQRERDRVEHLYAATRALASSRDASESIIEFLKAVADIVAAPDVRLILRSENGSDVWSVQRGVVVDKGRAQDDGLHHQLLDLVSRKKGSVLVGEAEEASADLREVLKTLDARTLMVSPLVSSEAVTGCLVTVGRVGAENFGRPDLRLLEALANELVVSLDSYKLFTEVLEERERFGRIFLGSKEGICLLDGSGVVRAWNPALERISGYPAGEAMDRVWSDVMTIRDRSEERVHGQALIEVGAEDELELVTKAGPSRWVTLLAGPVGDIEDGGWVVLVRDVTAEHEVEAAKSDFLSTISHELRTPLTTIKGSLQVLARGRANIPEQLADQMVSVTTRGAERLERLVMNLLAVSQIESGTMAVFPDKVDLIPIVRERIKALLHDHPQTTLDVPVEPLVVRADRERMSHVVEHLLENAAKFGGQGEIKIEVAHEGGYAHLSVTDDGPGIAPENHERIFERFVRLGEMLTRETQGAGIGLFIAQRSVEAMGGRIWVESKLGEGATFHVSIPMAHPAAVADAADSA